MKHLSIDIETYSSINLAKSGVYRYVESPDFEILLFAYSIDGDEPKLVDLAMGETLPTEIHEALVDEGVIKWAFNAQFERVCLSRHFGIKLAPESWRCTMIWAAILGLPLSLEGVGIVAGLEKLKLKEGKDLIRYFSLPCKPTAINGGRNRNLPSDDPEKWEHFKKYCIRDVEVEMALQEKFRKFPVSEMEWNNYHLDQRINDLGIGLDMNLVEQAIRCDEEFRTTHIDQARKLTGLENPNSTQQLKGWLSEQGVEVESLSKAAVNELLEDADGEVEAALELRLSLAKSSVKKYAAMKECIGQGGRARGLLQFYGANRTGRFAGRLIQVQNLPQNHLPDLELARVLIREGAFETANLLYDSIPVLLSELIRTAFVPKHGCRFYVADFSAIEARVIAWLAGEKWRMDVFASHGKIYEASAAQMFQVPIGEITKGSPLRQKGKIAELALGYGGSIGALKAMGALHMGVPEEELMPLVTAWRQANPHIVQLWWAVDKAATKAVKEKTTTTTHGLQFSYQSGMLFITLPSGRSLCYVKPRMGVNQFGNEAVTYEGVGSSKKWMRIESYGPKFVENIVQATARDLLVEAMQRLEAKGYSIVMHVHDEVVIEGPEGTDLEDICSIMGETPAWAKGLLMKADGYVCDFYKKE